MLKRILLLSSICILFLTGCSESKSQSYVGESDNWKVSYGRDERMVIEFIGDRPSPETMVNISIEQGASSSVSKIYLSEDDKLKKNITFRYAPDEVEVQITIKWDGKSESMNLRKL